jgi:hypothetical protein
MITLANMLEYREDEFRVTITPERWTSSSSVSFARALFQGAEAEELLGDGFPAASAVAAYYSLFHLGDLSS